MSAKIIRHFSPRFISDLQAYCATGGDKRGEKKILTENNFEAKMLKQCHRSFDLSVLANAKMPPPADASAASAIFLQQKICICSFYCLSISLPELIAINRKSKRGRTSHFPKNMHVDMLFSGSTALLYFQMSSTYPIPCLTSQNDLEIKCILV